MPRVCVATPGTDDVGWPEASQISELQRTPKWHDPPEEVREKDDFFGHETLAHGATCYAMRFESREGDTSQGKKEQARRHPRWDQRVIRSLRDEESVDPNGEWSKNATRKDKGVSDHTFRTRA